MTPSSDSIICSKGSQDLGRHYLLVLVYIKNVKDTEEQLEKGTKRKDQ